MREYTQNDKRGFAISRISLSTLLMFTLAFNEALFRGKDTMVGCTAPSCKNRSTGPNGLRFFRFPRDPERRREWQDRVRRPQAGWEAGDTHRLCQDHFQDHMFIHRPGMKIKLRKDAVPSIFSHYKCKPSRRPPATRERKARKAEIVMKDHNYVNLGEGCEEPRGAPKQQQPQPTVTRMLVLETVARMADGTEHQIVPVEEVTVDARVCKNGCSKTWIENFQLRTLLAKERAAFAKQLEKERLKNEVKSKLKRKEEEERSNFASFLNEDQMRYLKQTPGRGQTGYSWSKDTLKKAVQLKMTCGTAGYELLLKQKFPLPSLRTMRQRVELCGGYDKLFEEEEEQPAAAAAAAAGGEDLIMEVTEDNAAAVDAGDDGDDALSDLVSELLDESNVSYGVVQLPPHRQAKFRKSATNTRGKKASKGLKRSPAADVKGGKIKISADSLGHVTTAIVPDDILNS